jgi:hypothetical protein
MYNSYLDAVKGILHTPNMPASSTKGNFAITAKITSVGRKLAPVYATAAGFVGPVPWVEKPIAYNLTLPVNWSPLSENQTMPQKRGGASPNYWKHSGELAKVFKAAANRQKARLKPSDFANISKIVSQVQAFADTPQKVDTHKVEFKLDFDILTPGWAGKDAGLMDDLITKPYAGVKPNTMYAHLNGNSTKRQATLQKALQKASRKIEREAARERKKYLEEIRKPYGSAKSDQGA